MDDIMQEQQDRQGQQEQTGSQETATHIWLRYATQYTRDGRSHTIEMSVPVPVGADAQLREQLFREAEAGMRQLVSHVENRIPQMFQRSQAKPQAGGQSTQPSAMASSAPTTQHAQQSQQTTATPAARTVPPKPSNRPASVASPQTGPLPAASSQGREAPAEPAPPRSVEVPPTRPSVGASMPSTSAPAENGGGTLQLPQFLRLIKESLNLDSKQAMKLLNVRTLTGDINLREALGRLEHMVAQGATGDDTSRPGNTTTAPASNAPEQAKREPGESQKPREPRERQERRGADQGRDTEFATRSAPSPSAATPARSAPVPIIIPASPRASQVFVEEESLEGDLEGIEEQNVVEVREVRPTYFQEEVGPDDGLEELEELEDLEELDLPHEFSVQELKRARDLVDELREARGSTVASAGRLQVLNNVLGEQISKEQLHTLIEGLWSVTILKRLKVDQVEALISWGKEDNFGSEAEAVLAVLAEE